jgi:peptidoglycan/LPS O-acetylase OafA/YrhL
VLRDNLTGLWRPAPFLAGLILLAMLAWLRTRDRRVLLIPALVFVHSAVLMVAIIAQDARYQLPVYLVTLAVAPALALSRRTQPQRIEDGRAAG